MESVSESVNTILQNVTAELTEFLMAKLDDNGCESLDLKVVTEQDLRPPLKPIQYMKLLSSWKTAGDHCVEFYFLSNK